MTTKNKFDELTPEETAPKDIKDNVLGTTDMMSFFGGIVELYLGKLGTFFTELIKISDKKSS